MINELFKLNNRWAQGAMPQIFEAEITEFGNTVNKFNIQLKNGDVVVDVWGPQELGIGDAVTVGKYPGMNNKFVILSKSYKNISSITEVVV